MNMATFNVDDGFLEAIARGYRQGLLSRDDYTTLSNCRTLEDLKQQLTLLSPDYGPSLEELTGDTLDTRALEKALKKSLIHDFHYLRAQANHPLSKFLDYITYAFMIENLCLLIKGSIKGDSVEKLIESCNPLGVFPEMVMVCQDKEVEKMFDVILVDTPLAPYFVNCIDSADDLTELNVEKMKDRLMKEYLEDFYNFCTVELGGTTGQIMGEILEFEADKRAINIAINSLGHPNITKEEKLLLNPKFGSLYPEGFELLAEQTAENDIYDKLREKYEDSFGRIVIRLQDTSVKPEKYIEELLMEEEVKLNELAFYDQFHYGIFYSYLKLKETEIRNIVWIAECIKQHKNDRWSQNVVNIFDMAQQH